MLAALDPLADGVWIEADGKRRRPLLFRAVLSHSRKGYCEVVWRQDTETFLRCVENAFGHFGGATQTVVIDNLKDGAPAIVKAPAPVPAAAPTSGRAQAAG